MRASKEEAGGPSGGGSIERTGKAGGTGSGRLDRGGAQTEEGTGVYGEVRSG